MDTQLPLAVLLQSRAGAVGLRSPSYREALPDLGVGPPPWAQGEGWLTLQAAQILPWDRAGLGLKNRTCSQQTVFSGKAASPHALGLPGIEERGRAGTRCHPRPAHPRPCWAGTP